VKLAYVMVLTVLGHTGFVGSRVTVSLHAISEGATPFTVGLLMALYAALPMLIAVPGGRMIDRVGAYRPLAISSAVLTVGILLPFAWPALPMLHLAAVAIGTAFTVQHLALNHAVGALGGPADRAVNFSWFALAFSISGFLGPLTAGFTIDATSHRLSYLFLALPPAIGFALLLARPARLPALHLAKDEAAGRDVADLFREPRLRAAFIFSGLLAMGWDLYTFVVPIYGSKIGLSASTFAVRLAMPALARRVRAWTVVTAALAISGCAYSVFPLIERVPLLMALSFLLGMGLGCAQPMIMSLLYAASPPGRQGEVVGVRTTLLNASHTVLPLLFGALGAALGMGPVFWSMSALLLGGGWFALQRRATAPG
jgi:MFS family permease